MPAALDLTGQRFGQLTVLRRNGRVVWGRDQPAWLCECDCGAELTVPQRRLKTNSISQRLWACPACRTIPCEICGTPISVTTHAKTCSDNCRAEKQRRYRLYYYHEVVATDPEKTEKRRASWRDTWAKKSPEEKRQIWRESRQRAGKEKINARQRRRHQERMAADPEYAAARAEAHARYLASQTPEERRQLAREYARKYRARQAELALLAAAEQLRSKNDGES